MVFPGASPFLVFTESPFFGFLQALGGQFNYGSPKVVPKVPDDDFLIGVFVEVLLKKQLKKPTFQPGGQDDVQLSPWFQWETLRSPCRHLTALVVEASELGIFGRRSLQAVTVATQE